MEVAFADDALDRLETDKNFNAGFSHVIVSAYRKQLWYIRWAADERDLYAKRSLRFKRMKESRPSISVRLNDQWRLILELDESKTPKTVVVIKIEDYH